MGSKVKYGKSSQSHVVQKVIAVRGKLTVPQRYSFRILFLEPICIGSKLDVFLSDGDGVGPPHPAAESWRDKLRTPTSCSDVYPQIPFRNLPFTHWASAPINSPLGNMARGNRKPSQQGNTSVPDGLTTDDIDTFVASRHASMQRALARLSDSDTDTASDEPEQHQTNVLDIEMSDSDFEQGSFSQFHGAESGDERKEKDERLGFGGKKRDWYGGDTHEYEIMSDREREEALKDEEEEATRLQREALQRMVPEDYMEVGEGDQPDDASGEEKEKEEDEKGDKPVEGERVAEEVLASAAPELPHLVQELRVSAKEMEVWKGRLFWGEVARIMYHLHASLAVNISFFLALRTDPEMEGVALREHPVLERIVKIQEMLDNAKRLRCKEPANGSGKLVVDEENGKGEIKGAVPNEVTDIPTETPNGIEITKEKNPTGKPNCNEITKENTLTKIPNGSEMTNENCVGNGTARKRANGEMTGVASDDAKKQRKKRRKDRKRKRKERERVESTEKALLDEVKADEDTVRSLLQATSRGGEDQVDKEKLQARKRRKLSKLVGEMERERKNADVRQGPSGDADIVREEPSENKIKNAVLPETGNDEKQMSDVEDDDEVMQKMLAKKAKKQARKARKAAESKPHLYTFKDDVDPESRRKASSQVVKNRGLTRYRPKDKKTPRARNRLAYSKAVVRRKGAVQEYEGKPGVSYSGEASGINMAARKGSRLSNV